MYNRIKGFLEVNKAGEHPVIFIIAVFINSMYSQSKSCVRLNNTLTDFFGNYVGVKQGDNLSLTYSKSLSMIYQTITKLNS
jgi:hypothetical protein